MGCKVFGAIVRGAASIDPDHDPPPYDEKRGKIVFNNHMHIRVIWTQFNDNLFKVVKEYHGGEFPQGIDVSLIDMNAIEQAANIHGKATTR